MSMLGSVQAGLDLSGEKPVYTADGTSPGATLELGPTADKVEFTVATAGEPKDLSPSMWMTVGGCKFSIVYMSSGQKVLMGGGGDVAVSAVGTASVSASGVSYGKTGKCESGSFKMGDKGKVDVKFEYDDDEKYPLLKFTFTNAVKATPKEDAEMGGGTIALIVCGCIGALLLVVLIVVGGTWCCCWCERCCLNDPEKCSFWNRTKQQRKKALGLDKKAKDGKPEVQGNQNNAKGVEGAKPGQQQVPPKPVVQVGQSPVVPPPVKAADQNQRNPPPAEGVAVGNNAQGNNVQAGAI
ncbi:hypothetical protein M3Y95_00775900 [Aphelenchoides besseyi]|nr:hypothetical protein M3Y95_00775900 [Aphelenchoides besseyi]